MKTNARSALTTVATMLTALTPKVPLTVVANQGTEEMATTVQVGAYKVSSLLNKIWQRVLRVRLRLENSPSIFFQT